jgi:hypothetical protein
MSLIYDSHGDPNLRPALPVVIQYRETSGSGALKAFVSVHFPGGAIVRSIKYFSQGDRRWVKPPDQAYPKRNGETGYQAILEFATREAEAQFEMAVLAAIARFLGGEKSHGDPNE